MSSASRSCRVADLMRCDWRSGGKGVAAARLRHASAYQTRRSLPPITGAVPNLWDKFAPNLDSSKTQFRDKR
jgi:hypothetical protein